MTNNKQSKPKQGQSLDIRDFRSLDDYFDYCGLEKDYRPAYRQNIIAWLKLSDEEKLAMQSEQ